MSNDTKFTREYVEAHIEYLCKRIETVASLHDGAIHAKSAAIIAHLLARLEEKRGEN